MFLNNQINEYDFDDKNIKIMFDEF